jgi:hypothetical protein
MCHNREMARMIATPIAMKTTTPQPARMPLSPVNIQRIRRLRWVDSGEDCVCGSSKKSLYSIGENGMAWLKA